VAITQAFSGTNTVSTTEFSLTNNSTSIASQTTAGFYGLVVDMSAIVAGDEYEFALLEKAISGGTQRRTVIHRQLGAPADPLLVFPPVLLLWGWDFTAKKISGTDRSLISSVRAVT
jgi:hypothetical protein